MPTFTAGCTDAVVFFGDDRLARRAEGEPPITVKGGWPQQVDQWRTLIERSAIRHGVGQVWIAAVMAAESGGKADAGSSAGAQGLMQIMPGTFNWLMGRKKGSPVQPMIRDPELNIDMGAKLLSYLDAREDGNPLRVMASYNAGSVRCGDSAWPCAGKKNRHGVVTNCNYIDKVLGYYNLALEHGFSSFAGDPEQPFDPVNPPPEEGFQAVSEVRTEQSSPLLGLLVVGAIAGAFGWLLVRK